VRVRPWCPRPPEGTEAIHLDPIGGSGTRKVLRGRGHGYPLVFLRTAPDPHRPLFPLPYSTVRVLVVARLRYQAGRDAGVPTRRGPQRDPLVADTNPVGASARRGGAQLVRRGRSAQLTLGCVDSPTRTRLRPRTAGVSTNEIGIRDGLARPRSVVPTRLVRPPRESRSQTAQPSYARRGIDSGSDRGVTPFGRADSGKMP